jgi:hypothetical protein
VQAAVAPTAVTGEHVRGSYGPILLKKLSVFLPFCQITLCNEGFALLLAMISGGKCARLGYDLGYL